MPLFNSTALLAVFIIIQNKYLPSKTNSIRNVVLKISNHIKNSPISNIQML